MLATGPSCLWAGVAWPRELPATGRRGDHWHDLGRLGSGSAARDCSGGAGGGSGRRDNRKLLASINSMGSAMETGAAPLPRATRRSPSRGGYRQAGRTRRSLEER
jgi:hypothetical protein